MIELRTLGTFDLLDTARPEMRRGAMQPKRLALLAYLAIEGGIGALHRRDTLLGLFWPEADTERARGALRQAVHALRRTLGEGVLVSRGEGEIGVDAERLWCDAANFVRMLDAGRAAEAIELYHGDLLPGLFISGAPAFEEWLEVTRARLRARATDAAWRLTDAEDARGSAAAGQWGRRAVALAPDDEVGVRRLITLLAKYGDTAGALHTYDQLVRRLAREYDTEPAAETQQLAQAIRDGNGRARSAGLQPVLRPSPIPTLASVSLPPPASPPATRHRRAFGVALFGAIMVATAVWLRFARPDDAGDARVGRQPPGADSVAPAPVRALKQNTLAARRLYEEGQRLLSLGDRMGARRLFQSAVAEDSSAALALLYLGMTSDDAVQTQTLERRAVALAETAPDEERLMVLARWSAETGDARRRAYAETLAVRYPANPEGALLYAHSLSFAGDFARAAEYFRRVVSVDTAGLRGVAAACRACDAYEGLSDAYERMDSTARAVSVAREWIAAQPRSPWAWKRLGYVLGVQGRYQDALAAIRTAADIGGRDEPTMRAEVLMRAGDYATADILMAERETSPDVDVRIEAHFTRWMSLRDQGRYREALEEARKLYALGAENAERQRDAALARLQERQYEAITLCELGRTAEAAAITDSIARAVRRGSYEAPSASGRAIASALAWAASVRAARSDTAGFAALADTVYENGRRSLFGRDQRLHHYVRGLLLEARGDDAGAVNEFRQSLWSPTGGFVLANIALARTAMRIGRFDTAIEALGGALRGPVGASGTRASKTELHAMLGEAFDRAQRRDSAAFHYRRAVDAWQRADEFLRARRARLAVRLREIESAP